MILLLTLACAQTPKGPLTFKGASAPGGTPVTLHMHNGVWTAQSPETATSIDLQGKFVVPAVVDAHVHLAFLPEAKAMADGGVGAVVDWAAPLSQMNASADALQRISSGPMITAPSGYPTTSWGAGGYGIECADQAAALAAVETVANAGARVIKLPITTGPQLDRDALQAVVNEAHRRDLKVGTHAMSDADAAMAAELGIDLLVHVPVQPLSDATVAAWANGAVITTVDAFGGSAAAIENLRRLRAGGTTVLYGTDFGNSRVAGVQRGELERLVAAGMDGPAVLAATTVDPTAYFGFDLGLEVGKPASFLVLDADPLVEPLTLASPDAVWIRGAER